MKQQIRDLRAAAGTALLRIVARFVGVSLRLTMWRAPRMTAGPFQLINLSSGHRVEDQVRKLSDAATLLNLHDPRRLNRMIRHIPLLVIVDHSLAVEAVYHHFAKAVVIRASAWALLDVQSAAAVLVHEETHARLESLGIRHTPAALARIEQLCLRNELWFLEKVPGAEALAAVKRERFAESC